MLGEGIDSTIPDSRSSWGGGVDDELVVLDADRVQEPLFDRIMSESAHLFDCPEIDGKLGLPCTQFHEPYCQD